MVDYIEKPMCKCRICKAPFVPVKGRQEFCLRCAKEYRAIALLLAASEQMRAKMNPDRLERAQTDSRRSRFATIKKRILSRDGNRCLVCGYAKNPEVHHIIALASGGSNAPSNLITLCPNHHGEAHAGALTEAALRKCVQDAENDDLPLYDRPNKFI